MIMQQEDAKFPSRWRRLPTRCQSNFQPPNNVIISIAMGLNEEQQRHNRPLRTRPCWTPSTRIQHCIMLFISLSLSSFLLSISYAFNLQTTMYQPRLVNFKGGRIKLQLSAPAKDSESYDLDYSIEEDIIRDQLVEPNNKSLKSRRRRKSQKSKRSVGNGTLPTEPTVAKNRKKGRGGISISSQLPPWLVQYENEDFVSPEYYFTDEQQSTSQAIEPTFVEDTAIGINYFDGDYEPKQNDLSEMQRLQLALNGIFQFHNDPIPTTTAGGLQAERVIPYFSPAEIHEIIDSIRVASHGNSKLMAGCADFLYLMLTLEEEGTLSSELLNDESWEKGGGFIEPHSIMTRDVLVAASFHYCDCVRARKAGVYDYARQAMEASLDMGVAKDLKKELTLPPAVDSKRDDVIDSLRSEDEVEEGSQESASVPTSTEDSTSMVVRDAMKGTTENLLNSPVAHYGEESAQIAAGAARLKQAEIMATTVYSSNGGSSNQIISRRARSNQQTNGDAEILRSFILSLSDDWRALVIRSAACLYRLKGISEENDGSGSIILSKSTISVARDAFKVYAPLAQRLGMQRLKSELENTAFRILYPRQFDVASSLYRGDIEEMKSIIGVLSSRIEQLLRTEPMFISQIEDVTVTSRIKEPYSLWKKMLRYRKEAADAKSKDLADATEDTNNEQFASTLSMKWIPDAIALRVVLRAKRLSSLEDDESLRTREKLLCYYALQIIKNVWDASPRNEAKDYIKKPKPNGYQSLHYTASLVIAGEEWPL